MDLYGSIIISKNSMNPYGSNENAVILHGAVFPIQMKKTLICIDPPSEIIFFNGTKCLYEFFGLRKF